MSNAELYNPPDEPFLHAVAGRAAPCGGAARLVRDYAIENIIRMEAYGVRTRKPTKRAENFLRRGYRTMQNRQQ